MQDWDSKHYKEHAKAQEVSAMRIVNGFALKGNETILDIGSGDGKITRRIAARVPEGSVIGIDISPNMIADALATYSGVPNLTFLQKNAENFSFDQKFDLVVSFYALHWVKDHHAVLTNVKKVLKKGGRICFVMISGGDRKVAEVFEREPWKSHMELQEERTSIYTVEQYEKLLERLGFVQDKIEDSLSIYTHSFADIHEMANQYMTWLPYHTGLETDKCQKLAYEISENISCYQGTKTNIIMSSPVLYVEAHLP